MFCSLSSAHHNLHTLSPAHLPLKLTSANLPLLTYLFALSSALCHLQSVLCNMSSVLCPLQTVICTLFSARCPLLTCLSTLASACFLLHTASAHFPSALCYAYYAMLTEQCTLSLCTLVSAHCVLKTVHCKLFMHNVICTLFFTPCSALFPLPVLLVCSLCRADSAPPPPPHLHSVFCNTLRNKSMYWSDAYIIVVVPIVSASISLSTFLSAYIYSSIGYTGVYSITLGSVFHNST